LKVLDGINSAADLQRLNKDELFRLCEEIREEIVVACSKNGGHLASNLGVVELVAALHRTFDFSVDRLIFDVGHQCYAHKILTGRREAMSTLRTYGGISGFPKPAESIYDAFIAGHASTSVSAALGFARARTILGEQHTCVALIGDGALTGGLAYEALCDAGDSNEPLVIVLNDNGMSITENVGSMARYLHRCRLKPGYLAIKRHFRKLNAIPILKYIYKMSHATKEFIRRLLLGQNMFEEMGYEYIGPVDGHDIEAIETALKWAAEINKPALVHAVTQKGHGYEAAERSPSAFHGVGPFDPETGDPGDSCSGFSSVFGAEIVEAARRNPRIAAVTAAMTSGTGLTKFSETFPERFFDVGIAEGHAVTTAAAMASGGLIPVVAMYSTFLQRAYDMLLHDVALSGHKCILAIDRAGIVPGDGETHQGVYDIAYLSTVPRLEVWSPSNYNELAEILSYAANECTSPIAVRYSKGTEGRYRSGFIGGVKTADIVKPGSDITIVTYGIMINTVLDAVDMLIGSGIECEIIKLNRLCPIDMAPIHTSLIKTHRLAIVEDSAAAGCAGERISAALYDSEAESVLLFNCGMSPLPGGTVEQLREHCGIDAESIARGIIHVCKKET